jgi:hypothetical protein
MAVRAGSPDAAPSPRVRIGSGTGGGKSNSKVKVVTMTMEGIGNNAPVGSYYQQAYGVAFDPDALALVDQDDDDAGGAQGGGGSGNFAHAPSGTTTLQFYQKDAVVLNVFGTAGDESGGFETGVSFYYSSITRNGSVFVYDGYNGTGTVLAYQQFYPLGFDRGGGDPTGDYNRWRGVGLAFAGIARSLVFRGAVNRMLLDDITLGSATSRCPAANNGTSAGGASSTFELWDGSTDSRTAKFVGGGSYCLSGNWNVRVHTTHEMSTCGPVLIKFFTGHTTLRRQVEASPPYFLFGDDPVTRNVYGNTNAKPKVSGLASLVADGTTSYCVRAAQQSSAPGHPSQVCFVNKC